MGKTSKQRADRARKNQTRRRAMPKNRRPIDLQATKRRASGSLSLEYSEADLVEPQLPGGAETRRNAMAAVEGLLLGATVGTIIVGLSLATVSSFVDHGLRHAAALAGCLGALALGLRLPQNVIVWLSARMWHRIAGRLRSPRRPAALLDEPSADIPFNWTAMSVCCLLAGIVTVVAPLMCRATAAFDEWLHIHFVWSYWPDTVLQALLTGVTGMIPLAVIGLACSCAHRLKDTDGQWEPRTAGWIVSGAALGVLAATVLTQHARRPELTVAAASLPAFVASLLAATAGPSQRKCRCINSTDASPFLPTWSDRWPTLLRGTIVATGAGGAWAVALWASRWDVSSLGGCARLTAAVSMMGVGFLIGCRGKTRGPQTIGRLGVACAWAGVVLGSAMAWGNRMPGDYVWPATISLFAIGVALGFGHRMLLDRVAHPATAGLTIWSRSILLTALVVALGVPLWVKHLGHSSAFALAALGLLALGGTLIIHDPHGSTRKRRFRLCGVFGAVACMILLAPYGVPPRDRLRATEQSVTLHAGFPAHRYPSSPIAGRDRADNHGDKGPRPQQTGTLMTSSPPRHLKRPPARPDSP
ncbi:MAG: hypothetical protein JSU68_08265 [Phycisphaerales bacterium]|nr:MAG: hypothetical protein JSU68_08265 [Phycisphaerales bacterium]